MVRDRILKRRRDLTPLRPQSAGKFCTPEQSALRTDDGQYPSASYLTIVGQVATQLNAIAGERIEDLSMIAEYPVMWRLRMTYYH